jgi:hypothetical protein
MAVESPYFSSRSDIPQSNSAVIAPGGEQFPFRCERQAPNVIAMAS